MHRILVYSDLHMHCWTSYFALLDGHNSRLMLQVDVLRQMKNYCLDNEIQTVICCGDTFHTQGKLDSEVAAAACDIFQEFNNAGIAQTWLVGNHDQKNRSGTIHSLRFLEYLGVIVPNSFADEFKYLAYTEDEQKLKDFFASCGPNDICFIHQGVNTVPMTSGFTIDEIFKPEMASHVRHVFSGHYHSYKQLGNITIPGTPMQHNWGDEGEKRGWLDVIIPDKGSLKIVHVESKHPKFGEDWKRPASKRKKDKTIIDYKFDDIECLVDKFKQGLDPHTVTIGNHLMEGKYEVPSLKD